MPASTAALIIDALRLASSLTGFLRKVSENDEALAAIVAEAHANGKEVGADEIRAAIGDMHAAGEKLAEKIAGASA